MCSAKGAAQLSFAHPVAEEWNRYCRLVRTATPMAVSASMQSGVPSVTMTSSALQSAILKVEMRPNFSGVMRLMTLVAALMIALERQNRPGETP